MKKFMNTFVRNLYQLTTVFVFIAFANAVFAAPKQMSFSSPEEAVKALVTSVKDNDTKKLIKILGPAAKPLVASGDVVEDKDNREHFLKSYEEANKLEKSGDAKVILTIGKDEWQFPIPLVKEANGWRFDTQAGKEEILNRRVGRNELSTIKTILAYVTAQSKIGTKPQPYDGYFYRSLKTPSGYALIAWPATYGNSGVMTFIVNQKGIVYEKDLGPKTAKDVKKITTFNPDKTWKPVSEHF